MTTVNWLAGLSSAGLGCALPISLPKPLTLFSRFGGKLTQLIKVVREKRERSNMSAKGLSGMIIVLFSNTDYMHAFIGFSLSLKIVPHRMKFANI